MKNTIQIVGTIVVIAAIIALAKRKNKNETSNFLIGGKHKKKDVKDEHICWKVNPAGNGFIKVRCTHVRF